MGLATRHRPETFDEVVGQSAIITALRNAAKKRLLHPVYLIAGPYGVGKTTLARLFAKAVLCTDGTVSPCGSCDSCHNFDGNMRYTEIDAASHGGVGDVRSLIERAQKVSHDDGHVFYTIDEAHMLTKVAQNSFLNALEEGIPNTIFILVTTEPEKVLATVRSRCQGFYLRKPLHDEVVKRMRTIARREGWLVEDEVYDLIALHKNCHVRDAITLMEMAERDGTVDQDVVRTLLSLDLYEQAARVLLHLPVDPTQAICLLDTMLSFATVTRAKKIFQQVIGSSYKYHKGVIRAQSADSPSVQSTFSPVEVAVCKKLASVYGQTANQWFKALTSVTSRIDLEITLLSLADLLTLGTKDTDVSNYDSLKQKAKKRRDLSDDRMEASEFLSELTSEWAWQVAVATHDKTDEQPPKIFAEENKEESTTRTRNVVIKEKENNVTKEFDNAFFSFD